MKNILIIRFSSFGDIVQALSVTKLIHHRYPEAQIDWLTKSDFIYLPGQCPYVNNTISLKKEDGILGLLKISFALRSKNYDLVYDAHSNLRSFIIKFILKFFNFQTKFITRSKERWKRILLFKFRKNHFPSPYRGMQSFVKPLEIEMNDHFNLKQDWNFTKETIDNVNEKVSFIDDDFIVMAPSAAWEMKRWPVEHWKNLQKELNNFPLIFVGGPGDHFISEIVDTNQKKCLNLAGKLNLIESSYLVSKARLVISADTGIIHVADLLGVSGLSLIGPTAFGFPTNNNIKTLEVELPCRPCSKDGRGSCERKIYQECMVNISVDTVKKEALKELC
jgi:ADP-heptose:LPS heptosyltransferase